MFSVDLEQNAITKLTVNLHKHTHTVKKPRTLGSESLSWSTKIYIFIVQQLAAS